MRFALTALAVLLPACLIASPSYAGKADDTLHIAFSKELEHLDPYFNTAREGAVMAAAVWDGLLYRDPATNQYLGNLATGWTWENPTTLELILRQGVTFHNGEPFDADDVVYTLNFEIDPKNQAQNRFAVNWIDSAEKIDQFRVRLHTKYPFSAALEYLAGPVIIHPNDYYAKVGPAGVATRPIGTGPYKVVSVDPGKHFVLKRNDDYFAAAKRKAKIETIDIRSIPDPNAQTAELLKGGLDMVWQVPPDQAQKVEGVNTFQVINAPTMRIGFISMDAAGRSGADNPMTKLKVRQAINHAINRKGMVDTMIKGASQVINSACAPMQFGCEGDVTSYAYDPAKAKALLAEAGYPKGFDVDFYAYRDRPLAEAMIGMLAEVGIQAHLHYMPYAALREKRLKDGAAMSFLTWGSNSLADASASTGYFFTLSGEDEARDPEVADLLKKADKTADPADRKMLFSNALAIIANQAYFVPLWLYSTNYILANDVSFTPTPDELVRFYDISWK